MRSQREWNDRGQFHRIYPRPPRRNTPRGDEVERLLGYIGLMYPEYVRGRNAVTLTPATAVAQAGVALGETSWMVRGLNVLHCIKFFSCKNDIGDATLG